MIIVKLLFICALGVLSYYAKVFAVTVYKFRREDQVIHFRNILQSRIPKILEYVPTHMEMLHSFKPLTPANWVSLDNVRDSWDEIISIYQDSSKNMENKLSGSAIMGLYRQYHTNEDK